ncbi:MAG: hypothetical protein GWO24_36315, partial [Akkermansiaceae bacterium]|nr:hypothetical protein [Akkermansiaceae bacterium]
VELRDRLPLFKAISVVDRKLSYKNVRFIRGGFTLETGGGVAVITDVDLEAPDIMELEGEFLSRRPTTAEVDEALKIEKRDDDPQGQVEEEPVEPKPRELTLREAARVAREKGTEEDAFKALLTEARTLSPLSARYVNEARARQERGPILEGKLRVGLMREALQPSARLANLYPVDEKTGLRWLDLPLQGAIYEAGVELAEEIYTQGGIDP